MDSETSSLRYLDRSGRILTAVGTGLFDFGYRDGPAAHALLQHPLGVVVTPKGLAVCDTYNSALRRYDPRNNELDTLARNSLGEPSGAALLDKAGANLVVADTNNHRLVRVSANGEVCPFEMRGLQAPAPIPERSPVAVEIGPVELADEVELTATLPIPNGQKLDPSLGPPVQLSVSSDELLPYGDLLLTSDELPARTRLALDAAEGYLDVLLRVGTCEEGSGTVCNLAERRWHLTQCATMRRAPRDSTWGSGGSVGNHLRWLVFGRFSRG